MTLIGIEGGQRRSLWNVKPKVVVGFRPARIENPRSFVVVEAGDVKSAGTDGATQRTGRRACDIADPDGIAIAQSAGRQRIFLAGQHVLSDGYGNCHAPITKRPREPRANENR